jgi:hypothetical protein
VARPFRPEIDLVGAGPLRHEIVEPLQSIRLVLEPGPHGLAFDLQWDGVMPAHLEPSHVDRLDGRLYQDYRRFDQAGVVTGSIVVGDERIEADGWFGARDHSWGVRRSVGGFEPFTGSLPPEMAGVLFLWLEFATPHFSGHLQVQEDGKGNVQMAEGFIAPRDSSSGPINIVGVEHEIDFIEGTRSYRHVSLMLATDDGAKWEVEAEPLLTAWAYRGTGYDGGFNDGRGLGAFRGEVVEFDAYDVSHPEDVVLADGSTIRPLHREQGARLTVNGDPGYGHFPIMAIGALERYGWGG